MSKWIYAILFLLIWIIFVSPFFSDIMASSSFNINGGLSGATITAIVQMLFNLIGFIPAYKLWKKKGG